MWEYRKETVKKLLTKQKVYAKIGFADFEVRLYLSWIEDSATNRGVGGSNPSRRATIEEHLLQWVFFYFAFLFSRDSNPEGAAAV